MTRAAGGIAGKEHETGRSSIRDAVGPVAVGESGTVPGLPRQTGNWGTVL